MTEERTPYLPDEYDALLFGAAPSPHYAPIPYSTVRGETITLGIDNNEHIIFISRTATGAMVDAIRLPPDVVLARRIGGTSHAQG